MILLETANRIILEVLEQHLKGGNRANVDMNIADFDGVTFHIHTAPDSKSILLVSMSMKGAQEAKTNGGEEMLKELYGDFLQEQPEDKFDVTLKIDCDNVPGDIDKVIDKVSNLKKNMLGAPFHTVLTMVAGGKKGDVIAVPYRGDENMYFVPQTGQVTLIFNVLFKDADDVVLAKVFLQEFADARRRVNTAPGVTYSKEVPAEISHMNVRELDNQGFVSFVLFPRHYEGVQANMTVDLLQTFRNYLHYHIKCSKAHMHTRMRKRVESLLKILNRAKPEDPDKKKEKKTASGRTFVRQ